MSWRTSITETLGIAAGYLVFARIGQLVAIEPGNVSPVFPASGFALAMVLQRGSRILPALWFGSFLGNTWAFLDLGTWGDAFTTVAAGVTIGAGATFQATCGAYLIRRVCLSRRPFGTVHDVFCFVATQTLACTVSGTCGNLALCSAGLIPWSEFGYTWMTWCLGDYLGVILLTPLLTIWFVTRGIRRSSVHVFEMLAILCLAIGVSLFAFGGTSNQSLAFLPLPVILWAAVRGERLVTTIVVLVISAVAIWATATGQGPFVRPDGNLALLTLQVYMAICLVTGIAVAVALEERSRAEESLADVKARLEFAVRAGNIGLWDWDLLTGEVRYSDQFKIQLGYPPEVPWNSYSEWERRLHPDEKTLAVQRVRDYLERRCPDYVSTFRMRCRGGAYVWILSQGEAVWNAENKPVRILGSHVDISERRTNEVELEHRNQQLRQIAYAASHDLQEPLRAISSFGQLLNLEYANTFDSQGKSWLEAIVRSTTRMKSLVHDFNSYLQIDLQPFHSEPVKLDDVLAYALKSLNDLIRASKAEVRWGPLPEVQGNWSELSQVFRELISNAIKYRSAQPPMIQISARRRGNDCVISVRDNGIGIERRRQRQVFSVFRRLHRDRAYSGTGVGLAICRRVLERHGGRIWLESTPGTGSVFHFAVPAIVSEDSSWIS